MCRRAGFLLPARRHFSLIKKTFLIYSEKRAYISLAWGCRSFVCFFFRKCIHIL